MGELESMHAVAPKEFHAFPLPVLDMEKAQQEQFRLVEVVSRHLPDGGSLSNGDLGVAQPFDQPRTTRAVEAILAEYFGAEDAVLVRGGGTGAIRAALFSSIVPGSRVLFHAAPIYHTTAVTVEAMALEVCRADFNRLEAVRAAATEVAGAFVQHSRQRLLDSYSMGDVIPVLREELGDRPIISDDNYAVMKVPRIGCQLGADLSTTSTFKLLGPEGVGLLVGKGRLASTVRYQNRSGGCQVQGHEAMAVLRGLVYVPVAAAIQARVAQRVAERLSDGAVRGVAKAILANNEETIVLVYLDRPNARAVIHNAVRRGAAPHPVGAESRYELAPMFYRISKGMLAESPEWSETVVRINPCRAGEQQIIDLLASAIAASA